MGGGAGTENRTGDSIAPDYGAGPFPKQDTAAGQAKCGHQCS